MRTVAFDRKRDKNIMDPDEDGVAKPSSTLSSPLLSQDEALRLIAQGEKPALHKSGAAADWCDRRCRKRSIRSPKIIPSSPSLSTIPRNEVCSAIGPSRRIEAFQKYAGINPDGALNRQTVLALDKSLSDKSYDPKAEAKKDAVEPDAIRNEALRIARDLVESNLQTKTASIQPEKPATP